MARLGVGPRANESPGRAHGRAPVLKTVANHEDPFCSEVLGRAVAEQAADETAERLYQKGAGGRKCSEREPKIGEQVVFEKGERHGASAEHVVVEGAACREGAPGDALLRPPWSRVPLDIAPEQQQKANPAPEETWDRGAREDRVEPAGAPVSKVV